MMLLLSLSAFALPRHSEFSEKVDLAKDGSLQGRFRFPVPTYWALGFSLCLAPDRLACGGLERLGLGLLARRLALRAMLLGTADPAA